MQTVNELNEICDDRIVIPDGRHPFSWPTDTELRKYVLPSKQVRFLELFNTLRGLDAHLRLRLRLLDYKRARQKDYRFPSDTLTVVLDAKKPLEIGMEADEPSDNPYNYTNLTCFCAALEFRDTVKPKPTRIYLDAISRDKAKTTTGIIGLVDYLIGTDTFKEIIATKKKLKFRFDNASQFMSEQFAYYVLCELPSRYTGVTVSYLPYPATSRERVMRQTLCPYHQMEATMVTSER